MAEASTELRVDQLPSDPLLHVVSPDKLPSDPLLHVQAPDQMLHVLSPDQQPSDPLLHVVSPDKLPSDPLLHVSSPDKTLHVPSPDQQPSHPLLHVSSPDQMLHVPSLDQLPSDPLLHVPSPDQMLHVPSLDQLPSDPLLHVPSLDQLPSDPLLHVPSLDQLPSDPLLHVPSPDQMLHVPSLDQLPSDPLLHVPSLDQLPSDPLLHVLSLLDFRDLIHCSYVCRRLNDLSKHNPLWRSLCAKHWLLTDVDRQLSGESWFNLFKQFYRDLGRYLQVYRVLKRSWDQLKVFLQQRCPRMIASLKEGATEAELNDIEAQIGCRLPDDYRCSYRIHNGQKLVIPGLMGSMSLSNHYRSEVLLDVETAAGGFQQRKGMRRCLPLTFCFHTGLSQYMALEPAEGRRVFESFYPCPDQTAQDPSAIDMFITGTCFLEWFTSYVHNVVTGEFPIIREQIFRYVHEQGCVATTGDITVSVSTSFLPELSSVHPPHFFFTYRIRIEMSPTASPEASCQLDSRYWKITTSDGNVEEVQGPGVVGEFPVMTPGKVHEYASCTTFSTPSEYMEGHYTFHRLANKEEVFHVAIPRFHMVCPPFREPLVRTQKPPTNHTPRFDDQDDEFCDGDGDDFGDLRGINVAALEGAWCPRHI